MLRNGITKSIGSLEQIRQGRIPDRKLLLFVGILLVDTVTRTIYSIPPTLVSGYRPLRSQSRHGQNPNRAPRGHPPEGEDNGQSQLE